MPEVFASNQIIAKTARDAFGGPSRVITYWDDNRTSHVDLLICKDRPQRGVTSYATIGVSDFPLYKNGKEYPVRAEFVGACGSNFKEFDRAMSTAAFCVINSKWFSFPGAIFTDVLSMYKCSNTLQHIFFAPPFLWEDKLKTLDLPEKKVAWLLAVPISENERIFSLKHGSDQLEKVLEAKQIDILDLNRPSVL